MRITVATMMAVVLASGLCIESYAADVDENPPKSKRVVEDLLKELGGEHYPEDLQRVAEVGPVETDTTFYHIYRAYRKDAQLNRIIIFDNTPAYLGFYDISSNVEIEDVEEGAILLRDPDEQGRDGEGLLPLPIPDKGPGSQIRVSGTQVKFVKAPEPETPESETAEDGTAAGEQVSTLPTTTAAAPASTTEKPKPTKQEYEYREWTITSGGKVIKVKAQLVEVDRKEVIIKSAKNGRNSIPISLQMLSAEDRVYLSKLE